MHFEQRVFHIMAYDEKCKQNEDIQSDKKAINLQLNYGKQKLVSSFYVGSVEETADLIKIY